MMRHTLGLHYPETRRRRLTFSRSVARFFQGLGVGSLFWAILLLWLKVTGP